MHGKVQQIIRFGDYALDLSRGLLLREGMPVFMRPKPFSLLVELASNTGRVVPKSELIAAVWPGVFVGDDSLTQAVREVRKALDDDGQTIVKSVSRRGYMLAAQPDAATQGPAQPSVAVLRFANVSGSAADEAFVDGFTEEIMNGLARSREFCVLARTSVAAFSARTAADWRALAAELDAYYLVRGSVARDNDRIVAVVMLVQAATGQILWSDRFLSDQTAGAGMPDGIIQRIVNRLLAQLNDASIQRSMAKPAQSLSSYELVQRGIAALCTYRFEANEEARTLLTAAIEKDPSYGLAHSYLSIADLVIGGYAEAPREVMVAAIDSAETGVALAPEEARTYRMLSIALMVARQFDPAEHHLQKAIGLNPYNPFVMAEKGYLLAMRGSAREGLAWFDRAMQADPMHPEWLHYDRAIMLYAVGEYLKAANSIRLLPYAPHRWTLLAACYAQLGDRSRADACISRISESDPGFSIEQHGQSGFEFEHERDISHIERGVRMALG